MVLLTRFQFRNGVSKSCSDLFVGTKLVPHDARCTGDVRRLVFLDAPPDSFLGTLLVTSRPIPRMLVALPGPISRSGWDFEGLARSGEHQPFVADPPPDKVSNANNSYGRAKQRMKGSHPERRHVARYRMQNANWTSGRIRFVEGERLRGQTLLGGNRDPRTWAEARNRFADELQRLPPTLPARHSPKMTHRRDGCSLGCWQTDRVGILRMTRRHRYVRRSWGRYGLARRSRLRGHHTLRQPADRVRPG